MSDGAKLASGYIELTVKSGDAMKDILASITGLDKDAEKAGQKAGEALNKGLSDSFKKGSGKSGNSLAEEILLGDGSGSSTAQKAAEKTGQKVGKSLGDSITKSAKEAGADAGDAIAEGVGKGVDKAAKDAGKKVGDEITKAATKAGSDVKIEPKITPKVDEKATKKEAKSIPDIIRDEVSKASKGGGLDGVMVEVGEVAGKTLGAAIGNTVKDQLGTDLGGAASKVGNVLTSVLGDVDFAGVLNNTLDRGLKASAGDLATGLGNRLGAKLGSVLKDQVGEALGVNLADVAKTINLFRSGDRRGAAGSAVNLLGGLGLPGTDTAQNVLNAFDQTKAQVSELQDLLTGFGAGGGAATLGSFAGPAALGAAGGYALLGPGGISDRIGTSLYNHGVGRVPALNTSPEALGLPATSAGPNQLPTPVVSVPGLPTDSRFPLTMPTMNTKDLPSFAPLDKPDDPNNPTGRTYAEPPRVGTGSANVEAAQANVQATTATVVATSVNIGGTSLPSVAPSSSALGSLPAAGPHPVVQTPRGVVPVNPLDILAPMDKKASGGVITGPGTGTSDSILGIGADGVPTARVSNGEGVVKKSAMDRGGASIVDALNSGKLPGYDDGTTNVGGPPVPMPQIEVPQANTGQAGQFNSWLSQQQGKQYQYGTLYDCSGFMSQVYNQMTGKNMPRFNTESDLAAYGFVRGSQPGTFELGIHHGGGGMNSHMAGTLPDGRNVESADNGVQIGAGAHGASDKQFEDHWYLPGGGGVTDPAGMPPVDPASPVAAGAPGGIADRTQGYIPAGAGGAGQAGSSFASGLYQMGAEAINGLIDQAASAASTAASVGVNAIAPGAGGAAGGAASSAIGLATGAAKRAVSYGAQLAGIWTDAIPEILLPFGVPRWFQTDPTQFMPQIGTQPTGVTTGEKAQLAGAQQASGETPNPALSPSGPVQPGQLPGAQPVGAPVQMAQPQGVPSAPSPIGAPPGQSPGGAQAGPAVPQPVSPIAPPAPQSGPEAGQSPQTPKPQDPNSNSFFNSVLGNIAPGFSRGGIVGIYDDGGVLPAGGIAINQSKKPEPVFNHDQWGVLQDNLAGSDVGAPDQSSGGNDYSLHFGEGSVVVKDVDELMSAADSKQRLQRMRYGGRP